MFDTEHNSIRGGEDMTMARTLEVKRLWRVWSSYSFGWHFGDHGDCWQETREHCKSNTTREDITRNLEVNRDSAWRGFIVQMFYWFIGLLVQW